MAEPGQTFLHYRLVEKIGEGGMGVVWKAVDTSLGREVAIKILPEHFAAEPERLARFEREARVLASLNHPHIAGIFGLHEAPGVAPGPPTRFLSMELVPGEDLATVLARGPLPLERALDIARQIAQAVEAAHENGVIHRDLKPANVRVTPSGAVKVLDFGLAKAYDPATASDPLRSATVTSAGTVAGLILGTAAYMSPEQASGQPTDRRADIWSFGVMLYEMLSHRRLFDGETVSHTLADVLRAPIDLGSLPAGTPPALQALLARCLDRNRQRRLRDIGEARIALEDLLADPEASLAAKPAAARSSTRRYVPWLVTALAAVLAVVGFAWRAPAPATSEPTRRLSLEMPNSGNTRQGSGQAIAISSDGSRVVTVAGAGTDDMLYVRDIDTFEPRPIEGTNGASFPFLSPDDKWIGFLRGTNLCKVRMSGGASVVIGPVSSAPSGMFWADDGYIYTAYQGKLWRIAADGGKDERLEIPEAEHLRLVLPFVLPGSRVLLCNTGTSPGVPGQLYALDLDTRKLKDLEMPGSNPRYLPTGHVLFAQGERVFVAAFDLGALSFTGSPVPVHPRVWVDQGQIQLATSNAGTVAYLPFGDSEGQTLVTVDPEGNVSPLFSDRLPFFSLNDPRVSHDGRKLVLSIEGGAIYMIDLDTGTPTLMSEAGFYPLWSPDDREIAFGSSRGDSYDVYRRPVDLSRPEEIYLDQENNLRTGDWSRLGPLVIRQEIPGKGMDLFVIQNVDDPTMVPLLEGDDDELAPSISADGKWVAFVSNYSGTDEIYVTSFPHPAGRQQMSIRGGTSPTWAPDGSALYYFEGNKLIEVSIETEPRLRVTGRRALFEGNYVQYRWSRQYDIFPDGKRFVLIQNPPRGNIEIVTNWFAELREMKD